MESPSQEPFSSAQEGRHTVWCACVRVYVCGCVCVCVCGVCGVGCVCVVCGGSRKWKGWWGAHPQQGAPGGRVQVASCFQVIIFLMKNRILLTQML